MIGCLELALSLKVAKLAREWNSRPVGQIHPSNDPFIECSHSVLRMEVMSSRKRMCLGKKVTRARREMREVRKEISGKSECIDWRFEKRIKR